MGRKAEGVKIADNVCGLLFELSPVRFLRGVRTPIEGSLLTDPIISGFCGVESDLSLLSWELGEGVSPPSPGVIRTLFCHRYD